MLLELCRLYGHRDDTRKSRARSEQLPRLIEIVRTCAAPPHCEETMGSGALGKLSEARPLRVLLLAEAAADVC